MMRVKMSGGQIVEAATGDTGSNGGWQDATPTERPEDTLAGTWVEGAALVDGEPTQTWEFRPWTASELAAQDDADRAALARSGVASTLRARAEAAMATNAAFLALTPPTAAQIAAQVRELTKQSTTMIRLALGALDSTEGS